MKEVTLIKNDLFDIAWQIESLGDYMVVYNHRRGLYEARNKHTEQLCVTLFSRLDQRSVDKVRETKRENIDRLIKRIEENNGFDRN